MILSISLWAAIASLGSPFLKMDRSLRMRTRCVKPHSLRTAPRVSACAKERTKASSAEMPSGRVIVLGTAGGISEYR